METLDRRVDMPIEEAINRLEELSQITVMTLDKETEAMSMPMNLCRPGKKF